MDDQAVAEQSAPPATEEWETQISRSAKKEAAKEVNVGQKASLQSTKKSSEEPAYVAFVKGKTCNITKVNPVQLQAKLTKSFGNLNRIYVAGKDTLKIYATNEAQLQRMLAATEVDGIEITASKPVRGFKQAAGESRKPNRGPRGVITGVPDSLTVEDIKEACNAAKVSWIEKTQAGRRIKTTAVLITFKSDDLPADIKLGYRRFKVRQYNPTPTRCFKCQAYGHQAQACRSSVICPRCAGKHAFEACPAKDERKCPNCKGNHTAAYRGCPKYKAAQQIVRVAELEQLSYAAAAKRHLSIQKPTPAVRVVAPAKPAEIQPHAQPSISAAAEEPAAPVVAAAEEPMTTEAGKTRKRRRRGGNKKGAKQKKRPDDSTAPESSEESEDEFPSTPPRMSAEDFKKTTPPPTPRKGRKGKKGKASQEQEVSLRSLGLFLFRMVQLLIQEDLDAETRQFEFATACTKILGIDIKDVNKLAGAN